MRPRERALINRLKEIVEFVEGMGKGTAVIENGDCLSYEDSKRIRAITGAHSTMIATAAEANPTVFSPTPLADVESTLVPSYLRLGKYLDNHWSSTKFCAAQFKGAHIIGTKADTTAIHQELAKAKGYDDVALLAGQWVGEQDFAEIVQAIESREGRRPIIVEAFRPPNLTASTPSVVVEAEKVENAMVDGSDVDDTVKTPQNSHSPDPSVLCAPLGPANELRVPIPAFISGQDAPTPTPSQNTEVSSFTTCKQD
ncbi:hypothetical protein EW026_g6030 [Hermanssonia centrifuga]|uniref:DUS-like FMN-binding domain-containing protein n=1 Tax=Hermanssonia centrifuga TaxID=98765 RepID=A0A4S4KCI7_9APHY|nr:hypothetical protein EW026_g6030 [Hermanssonia centrifuga]